MVEAGCADPDEVAREGVRVVGADLQADGRHRVVELDHVRAGQHDPDAVADLGFSPALIRSTTAPNSWDFFSIVPMSSGVSTLKPIFTIPTVLP